MRNKKTFIGPAIALLITVFGTGAFAQAQFLDETADAGLDSAHGFRLSITDANADTYPDIFVNSGSNQYLYVLDASTLQYSDISSAAGIQTGASYEGTVSADVDNDGDLDLFCFGLGGSDLLLNQLVETSTVSYVVSSTFSYTYATRAAVFVDYDNDGNIDIFIGTDTVGESPRLLNGDGTGSFSDVTLSAGIDGYAVRGYAVSAFDFNGDNLIDLFAPTYSNARSNPNAHSYLFQNNGDGTFTEAKDIANYDIFRGWVGGYTSFGSIPRDFDFDGDFDFIENIIHGDNGEITPDPHTLIVENVNGVFDWTSRYDAFDGRYVYDRNPIDQRDHYTTWFDIENDGFADVALAECTHGSDNFYVFNNDDNNGFDVVTSAVGLEYFDDNVVSTHNVIALDYDMDGDEDLLIGTTGDKIFLYSNETVSGNHWVKVLLNGGSNANGTVNRAAIGAKVEVVTAARTYTQYVSAGNGHAGPQEQTTLHFGIGTSASVDEIRVTWPDNTQTVRVIRNPAVDELHEIDYDVPPCTSDADCDDGDACTVDFCNAIIGECEYSPNNHTFEAETMYHSTGNAYSDGWNIYSNGYISFNHTFSGSSQAMTVRAAGAPANGIWPDMRVEVDGTSVYIATVAAASWNDYSFTLSAPAGNKEVRIYFTNDYYGSPTNDRNLYVDKAVLECTGSTTGINLGPLNTRTPFSVNGSQELVIDQLAFSNWTPSSIVLGIGQTDGRPLDGVSVSVDGNTPIPLTEYWQQITIPFASQPVINLTVYAASQRSLEIQWWASN